MKKPWIGLAAVLLLGGLATVFQLLRTTEAKTSKLVALNYNGYITTTETTAADVATFLLEEVGDYSGMAVSPDPESKLMAGDTVTVQDMVARALDPVVSRNFQIATAPPPPPPAPPKPVDKPKSKVYSGLATWYRHGSGLNTASRDFPKGTRLRVVAVKSGKSVDVVVNDYGPQARTGISLDLNAEAFERIAPLGAGKIEIKYFKL
jgi:hypothetical protein